MLFKSTIDKAISLINDGKILTAKDNRDRFITYDMYKAGDFFKARKKEKVCKMRFDRGTAMFTEKQFREFINQCIDIFEITETYVPAENNVIDIKKKLDKS